ncbi:MAG: transglutaminase domain-containing protein [Bacteroidales bacterium]
MKRNYFIYLLGILLLLLQGCGIKQDHFITNEEYRTMVERDFKARENILKLSDSSIFSVFNNSDMLLKEREAMEFLYAYSPLEDIAMFNGDFWLGAVKQTFKVKKEMPWGDSIPEDIFRHYVLPLRANNEALDSARFVFYNELAPRVRGCKTMEEAALVVNHWCHQKANYEPTNGRTCSPMAMIIRSYGRCGEESVFAIAALRSVGLPARQIYTPRWAHCDDNHAWIEVWVNGQWKFLGACEPEPALNMAWFTFPASRGLFMQTKVFGKYSGTEEVIKRDSILTFVNTTATYTNTNAPKIKVVDNNGTPVPGALVEYKVYNYSEYYTVAELVADKNGETCITIGQGDWVIWASIAASNSSSKAWYGFIKVNPKGKDEIVVKLDKLSGDKFAQTLEIIPPNGRVIELSVNEEARIKNDILFAKEDSIRAGYVATFDKGNFKTAMGNYKEIQKFIYKVENLGEHAKELLPAAKALLTVVEEKDLQDTKADVLFSHLIESKEFILDPNGSLDFITRYIVSPRISTETITAWRPTLKKWLANKDVAADITTANAVVRLLEAMGQIKVDASMGRGDVIMAPNNVARTMVTEAVSMDVFFVAACRTMGVPARLNPTNGKPQYYDEEFIYYDAGKPQIADWRTVTFDSLTTGAQTGKLMLTCNKGANTNPLYFINFTVSKLENGSAKLMELGDQAEGDMGAGMKFKAIFKQPVTLEVGDYIIVTGNRKSDGSVVSNISTFKVEAGKTTVAQMEVPFINETFESIGKIDKIKSIQFPAKGYTAIAVIAANNEPTNHMIRDISAMATDFEKLPIKLTFLFRNADELAKFTATNKRTLPKNLVLRVDNAIGEDSAGVAVENPIHNMILKKLNLSNANNLPLLLVVNGAGDVVYLSQGYKIGLGYQIMKYINK